MRGRFSNGREIAGVAAAFLVGSCLALQGWRSRVPSFDLIPHLEDAEALVQRGVIPNKGCLSSFGAYIPPGPTWLCAPGIAASLPGRLVEYPSTLFLFALTAVGIHLLANHCFGAPAGCWSAAVYCVSDRGLFFASSLWPRGHPAFVVWTVLFLCLWVTRRRAAWLGAAFATFAVGMYVFMEILPLALAVPFVWLRYRPPIRIGPLLAAGAVAGVVWSPYLHFEAGRDWRDLRAILTKTPLPLGDYLATMCMQDRGIIEWKGEILRFSEWEKKTEKAPAAPRWSWLNHVGVGLAENLGWAFFLWLGLLAIGIADRMRRGSSGDSRDSAQGVLWRSLLVPWVLLLLIPEGSADLAGRRFWWLWPLQGVAGVGTLSHFLKPFPTRATVCSAALAFFAFCSGEGINRLTDWLSHGPRDADQWIVCQRIARDPTSADRTTRVGYVIEVWAHALKFRPFDHRYKVGWEWDWLLRYDFGVRNTLDCPEGIGTEAVIEVYQKNLLVKFAPYLLDEEMVWGNPRYSLYRRRNR